MKNYQKIIITVIVLTIGILTTYLFYNQAINKFDGDLATQISYALNDSYQYSLTGQIYGFLYNYLGGNLAIAIFLSLVIIVSIIITKKILQYYMKSQNQFLIWTYAILLNFVIAIYLPFIFKNWVLGVQEPNEWHNSTYICMRPLGLIAILLYFKIEKEYLHKIDLRSYTLFCIVLILVNLVKPNFIIAFAPTMLVFLIIDFFRNIKDKKAIRNMIIFGCAVLISLPVLIYQSSVLYVDGSESGVGIEFMKVLKLFNNHPIISIIQSAAFPLFMLMTNFKTIMKNQKYSFPLVLNIVGLSEYLLLYETGPRLFHANFAWGYSFTLMVAFITSIALLSNSKEEKRSKIYYIIAYTLLVLHIISGLVYFGRLLQGYSYY
ncbi:MAG: hypothetical protein HFJ48_00955 [Clostridia bacterium]|nr:hypothetical protein [Clostridia bacterium]